MRFMASMESNAFVIVMLLQTILVLIRIVPAFAEVIQHKPVVVIGELISILFNLEYFYLKSSK